ncbi:uncharacterized protein LOC144453400 [Glandiceps talaboti]
MDLKELTAWGKEQLGLEGANLVKFVNEQQAKVRDERQIAREEREKEKGLEREREHEKAILQGAREQREHELRMEKLRTEGGGKGVARPEVKASAPKLPAFDEGIDDMDAYLCRFERFAGGQQWPKETWATTLSALLKGKALTVYSGMVPHEAVDYDKLKDALLKRYQLNEEGFRVKFRSCLQESSETASQYAVRLEHYLDRWLTMGKVDGKYNNVKDLLLREQFLNTCDGELALFLNERAPESIQDMACLADRYREARKQYESKGQSVGKTSSGNYTTRRQNKDNTGDRQPGPLRCYRCGKVGHIKANCRQNMIGTEKSGQRSVSDKQSNVKVGKVGFCAQVTHVKCGEDNCFCLQGRDTVELKCGHELPVMSMTAMSRQIEQDMPVVFGLVNGQKSKVLRDSGCNAVVVRKGLVDNSQMTGEVRTFIMMDRTCRRAPVAKVTVDTPFYSGVVEALCMETPLYDLILGNFSGVRQPDDPDPAWHCHEVSKLSQGDGEMSISPSGEVVDCKVSGETKGEASPETVIQAVQTRAQVAAENRPVRKLVVPDIGTETEPVTAQGLQLEQQKDETLKRVREYIASGKEVHSGRRNVAKFVSRKGLIYREFQSPNIDHGRVFTQLVVPLKFRQNVLRLAHESIVGGHLGSKKTRDKILTQFYWPGIDDDVMRCCRSCDICQKTSPKGKVSKVPLGSMPSIDTPFKRVAVDLVGPLHPVTDRGNRYILTLVDYATRYPEAVALKRIQTEVVAEALVSMYTRLGIPEEILSDLGTQFISDLMQEVDRLLSIKQLTTTPYHPACNGLVERFNGTLKSMLRRMCTERPKDWDRYLDALLFAYREAPQASLGFSPFELLYGRTVRGPMTILRELWTNEQDNPQVKSTYQYILDLRERLEDTCKLAQEELTKSKVRYKQYYDRRAKDRQFSDGDKVLVLLPTNYNKLLMKWQGPYRMVERVSNTDYRIDMDGKLKLYHANMLKKYEERVSDESNSKNEKPVTVMGVMQCVAAAVIESEIDDENNAIKSPELVDTIPIAAKETIEDVNISDGLSVEQRREVKKILKSYSDVLTDLPGECKIGRHDIKLTTKEPVRSKPYPLPFAMKEVVQNEVKAMLDMGVIEQSESPYASPIVLVRKKDKSVRFCIDFRKLNRVTVFDAEPMPNPEELLARQAKGCYFTKIDLTKGYWQIPLTDEAKEKTAFLTPDGLFQFRRMPFGLVNAPASFCRVMRVLLSGMEDVENLMDDMLISTVSWKQHSELVVELLSRLRKAGLTARPSKCYIGYANLEFIGHGIGQGLLRVMPDKVHAIVNTKQPETIKEVKSFLGLANYYRKFVPNFAAIAVPLTDLTRKGQPKRVNWGESQERAFKLLKEILSREPVLRLPDFEKTFILRTDASDVGLGAVLMQEFDDGKFPLAYASRKLHPREKSYSVIERECLAIIWAMQKLQQYLYGREFILETDHQPLIYLKRAKVANSRLMRWALYLQSFNYRIVAIKGSMNIGADYLSRSITNE